MYVSARGEVEQAELFWLLEKIKYKKCSKSYTIHVWGDIMASKPHMNMKVWPLTSFYFGILVEVWSHAQYDD